MIHQVVSGPSRDQLFHLSTAARVIPYRIVNGVAVWGMPAMPSIASNSAGHKQAVASCHNPLMCRSTPRLSDRRRFLDALSVRVIPTWI